MTRLVPVCCLIALCASCSPIPVYQIQDTAEKGGLGFFPIIAFDQRKTIYEQTWYELTVTKTLAPADDPSTTYTQKIVRYTSDPESAGKVYRAFSAEERPEKGWAAITEAFIAPVVPPAKPTWTLLDVNPPAPFDLINPSAGKELQKLIGQPAGLAIVSVEHSQVHGPGRKKQYFNVQAPYGGTAQADAHLNTDGSLSEGSGQIEDTMPGKWVDAFSAITAAGLSAIGSVFKAAGEGKPGIKSVQLDVKPVRRLYTLTLLRPVEFKETDCGTLESRLQGKETGACRASLITSMAPADTNNSDPTDAADNATEDDTSKKKKTADPKKADAKKPKKKKAEK